MRSDRERQEVLHNLCVSQKRIQFKTKDEDGELLEIKGIVLLAFLLSFYKIW